MLPLVADEHDLLKDVSKKMSFIFFSDEFILLKQELEDIYSKEGYDEPSYLAVQDAIYAILSEKVSP